MAVEKTHFNSVGPDGKPALLSSAVRAGDFVWTAGAVPTRDPDTDRAPHGIAAQTKSVLTRLQEVLGEAGATLKDVIKVNIYLINMSDFQGMNGVYRQYFTEEAPARTTVQVAGLAASDFLVEIEMVARVSE